MTSPVLAETSPPKAKLSRIGLVLLGGAVILIWLIGTPDGLLGKADAIGYAVCHRIDLRSFHLGERVLPLCARCSGMYLGILLSFIYFTLRRRKAALFPPKHLILLLGGMMTESPPSSMRLTTLTIPVCFFIMLAMWKIILLAKKAFANFPSNSVLFTGIALFAFISLRTYFQEFTPQRISGGSRAELATEVAPLLNDLKATHQIYFVGAPWMYWGFATLPYLVQDAEVVDIIEPLEAPSSIIPPPEGKGALFVVLSERFDELEVIRDAFPNGNEMAIFGATEAEVLGLIYRVPP